MVATQFDYIKYQPYMELVHSLLNRIFLVFEASISETNKMYTHEPRELGLRSYANEKYYVRAVHGGVKEKFERLEIAELIDTARLQEGVFISMFKHGATMWHKNKRIEELKILMMKCTDKYVEIEIYHPKAYDIVRDAARRAEAEIKKQFPSGIRLSRGF
jgi:hypothetical protein